jgi:hypothetical protein
MHPNFIRAAVLALSLSLIAILSWEFNLRHKGHPLAYDDNEALWADKRARVYEPADKTIVFIGSSRIKYDLDILTWRMLTGKDAVQLANVGSSPRAVLTDLANDPNFKGNVVIDVTEGLFFSERAVYDGRTNKKIAYYHNRTPTQRFSFQVDYVLESRFVFLDQDNFSINAMMDNLPVPPRPGVFPGVYFPIGFSAVTYDRQTQMTPDFVADTNQHNAVRGIWAYGMSQPFVPLSIEKTDAIFNSVKTDVDKIKARGGQVLFVRTPSIGPYRAAEVKGYPKTAYWDRLLATTGCKGIYFEDYPATSHFVCPEWSHLTPADAVLYTKAFVQELQEKEWPSKNISISQ